MIYGVLLCYGTESMEPLVWDFGQLNSEVEKLYIHQIVMRYVTKQEEFDEEHADESELIETITNVLAAAQAYMREQKDECSFVSLRDVERAMMVMKWFYWLCSEILDELIMEEEWKSYSKYDAERGEDTTLSNRPTVGIFLVEISCG